MKLFEDFKKKIVDYNNLVENSNEIVLQPLPELQEKEISTKLLELKNANINAKKARTIIDLIPLNENYIEIVYATNLKNNKEYTVIATTKYLWFVNLEGYVRYEYKSLKAELVRKKLLSNVINLSGFILDVIAMDDEFGNFINIINDETYRNNKIIQINKDYGTEEIYKTLNDQLSGLSYDKNYNIRFYFNNQIKLMNIKEISNFQLILDKSLAQEKRLKRDSKAPGAKNNFFEMSLRIIDQNNQSFTIPILVQNNNPKIYSVGMDEYTNNLNYGKKLMSILDHLSEEAAYVKKAEIPKL